MSDKIPLFSQSLLNRLKAFSKDSSSRTFTPVKSGSTSSHCQLKYTPPTYPSRNIEPVQIDVKAYLGKKPLAARPHGRVFQSSHQFSCSEVVYGRDSYLKDLQQIPMLDYTDEPVEYPIDGILDLHHFSPKDISELVPEYITACLEKRITEIRIIHGKGIGNLRRTVHVLLDRNVNVVSYRLDGQSASSWGATLVTLARKK